jgi:predicted methyltransferase
MQKASKFHFVHSVPAALIATACASSPAPSIKSPEPTNSAVDSKLMAVLTGKQRPAEETARDVYRHPRETLEFFGIREDMKVVELSAGRGWYTAILAPLLIEKGSLTVTGADPNGPADSEGTKNAKAFAERLSQDPVSFGKVTSLVVDWKKPDVSLGPDASADMVVTFRNWHGWESNGLIGNVLSASLRVLKSGGILGVEEHRAKADPTAADPKVIGDTGYVPEALVVSEAEKAGFKLVGKSEINANPKDTKDYPKGVWTLPPTLRLGDVDRDKYVAIGESDRMTLKFVKP